MAKLHSCDFSNSSRCAGVITLSTRSRLCCGVSGLCVIGDSLPWTFMDGGTPAVMNRSEAFLWAINFRKLVKSMLLLMASYSVMRCREAVRSIEQLLVLGIFTRLHFRDEAALDQVL